MVVKRDKTRVFSWLGWMFALILGLSSILSSQALAETAPRSVGPLGGIADGQVFRLKNVGSGKFLNVFAGDYTSGTNVVQWTEDGSTEQYFQLKEGGQFGSYRICAMGSPTKMLTVKKNSAGEIVYGANALVWTFEDRETQEWTFSYEGNGKYSIYLKYSADYYLQTNGTANGTRTGTSSSSAGNVFVGNFASNNYDKWELVRSSSGSPFATTTSYIKCGTNYLTMDYNYLSGGVGAVGVDTLSGGNNQRWVTANLGDGTYRIAPYYAEDHVLTAYSDTLGAEVGVKSVDIVNGREVLTRNQRWRIVANKNGTYRIAPESSYNSKVLQSYGVQGMGGVSRSCVFEYDGSSTQQWVFEGFGNTRGIVTLQAQTYPNGWEYAGFTEGKIDSTASYPGIINTFNAMSPKRYVSATQSKDQNGTTALKLMRNSAVTVCYAHGTVQDTMIRESLQVWFGRSNIESLPANALQNTKLVIYASCAQGHGGENAINLMTATRNKGAQSVIAWAVSIKYTHANQWLGAFFTEAAKPGVTVEAAVTTTNNDFTRGSDITSNFVAGNGLTVLN